MHPFLSFFSSIFHNYLQYGFIIMNMIITITCNPAIDRSITDKGEIFNVGGKGINVSKVLKNIGVDSLATGFIGKDNKDIVYEYLDELGIGHHFFEIEGKVRVNTKRIVDGELVEENEKGPDIDDESKKKLLDYCESLNNEIVVISGSAPKNIEDDYYKKLIEILKKNNNYVIVDCDKALLKKAVEAKPDVIKPNIEELKRLLGEDITEENMTDKVKELGIGLSVISMGSKGAVFIGEKVYKAKALKVNFVSPLGAGDSMVASLAYSKLNNLSYEDTVVNAMAFASAQVETEGSKPAQSDRIEYYKGMVVYG